MDVIYWEREQHDPQFQIFFNFDSALFSYFAFG